MFKIIPAALFFLSFFASLISNAILRRLSIKYKLFLDEPNKQRKFHKKITPVTGGIGISIGIIFSALFLYSFDNNSFNLTQEESIYDIHKLYLESGADIIETNTFNSTQISQKDYLCENFSYDLNYQGGIIARRAVDDYMEKNPKEK